MLDVPKLFWTVQEKHLLFFHLPTLPNYLGLCNTHTRERLHARLSRQPPPSPRVYPQAGNVKFVDLFQEPGGRSKGCAVVEYETAQEAHAAIRDLHDTDLMGRLIFVREDREGVRWSAA